MLAEHNFSLDWQFFWQEGDLKAESYSLGTNKNVLIINSGCPYFRGNFVLNSMTIMRTQWPCIVLQFQGNPHTSIHYNNRHHITTLPCFFMNEENQFHMKFPKVLKNDQAHVRWQASRKGLTLLKRTIITYSSYRIAGKFGEELKFGGLADCLHNHQN